MTKRDNGNRRDRGDKGDKGDRGDRDDRDRRGGGDNEPPMDKENVDPKAAETGEAHDGGKKDDQPEPMVNGHNAEADNNPEKEDGNE